ncbi:MAG: hypothetical protein SXV54_09290 [Chloroflexota bacterium]|nr:hypothetical protein [Chloroflexota bacterium]
MLAYSDHIPSIVSARTKSVRGVEETVQEFYLPFFGPRIERTQPLTLLPGTNRQFLHLWLDIVDSLLELGFSRLTFRVHGDNRNRYTWIPGGSEQYGDLDRRDDLHDEVFLSEIDRNLNEVSASVEVLFTYDERLLLARHNYTPESALCNALHSVGEMLDMLWTQTRRPRHRGVPCGVPAWGSVEEFGAKSSPLGDSVTQPSKYYWFAPTRGRAGIPEPYLGVDAPKSLVLTYGCTGHGENSQTRGKPGQAWCRFAVNPPAQILGDCPENLKLPGSLYHGLQAIEQMFWDKAWHYIVHVVGDDLGKAK